MFNRTHKITDAVSVFEQANGNLTFKTCFEDYAQLGKVPYPERQLFIDYIDKRRCSLETVKYRKFHADTIKKVQRLNQPFAPLPIGTFTVLELISLVATDIAVVERPSDDEHYVNITEVLKEKVIIKRHQVYDVTFLTENDTLLARY